MERVFHRRQHAEHVMRGEIGLEQAGTVEKHALPRWSADRSGVAVAAHAHQRDARHEPQQFQRTIEEITPFTDVGTASDEASCHSVSYQEANRGDSTHLPPSWKNTTSRSRCQTRKNAFTTAVPFNAPSFETGGTSRPRQKSPTVAPSSRRPRNIRNDGSSGGQSFPTGNTQP
jgi:hypothetical protein